MATPALPGKRTTSLPGKVARGQLDQPVVCSHNHGQVRQTPSSDLTMSFSCGSYHLVRLSHRTGATISDPLCATGDTQHPKAGTGHAIGHHGELLRGVFVVGGKRFVRALITLPLPTLRADALFPVGQRNSPPRATGQDRLAVLQNSHCRSFAEGNSAETSQSKARSRFASGTVRPLPMLRLRYGR